MVWSFELVAGPFTFTEGANWDGQAVLFTDIANCRIMRYDPRSGACTEYRTATDGACGLTLDRQGRLYAAAVGGMMPPSLLQRAVGKLRSGGGRHVVRYEADGSVTVLATQYQGKRLNSPNDLVVNSQGRVWFTDPCSGDRALMELDHTSVYRLDPQPDGAYTITRVIFDTTGPNGLCFSPDERTLYVAESPPAPEGRRQLRAYPVQADGTLGEYRVLHEFGPHRGIDGMRVDAEGNIVATCGSPESGPGPRIAIFAPDGAVLAEHPTPMTPTNCTFGDDDVQTLYVTSREGSLHRARTDRRGLRR